MTDTRHPTPRNARLLLILAGILLIAANLRAPITGLPPLLPILQPALDLDTTLAGLLTTLPLLAFAFFSPLAPRLARRTGLEAVLFAALVLIAGGIALRSLGPQWSLFAGTAAIGIGIALGNVLLPSLIKRDFPTRIPSMTGAYALTMGMAAAMASATMTPLATRFGLGWDGALATMIVLPLAALAVWWTRLSGRHNPAAMTTAGTRAAPVWTSALAWQVTLFMGLNSFVYYVIVGWLPTILLAHGHSATGAGSLHGLMQLASAVPGLLLGPLIQRSRNQKAIAVAVSLLIVLALGGLLAHPSLATLWVVCFGFGAGAGVTLSLMFMGLRTRSPEQAAALSGMAQCIGYLLAASGPPLIGWMHDAAGSWDVPLAGCLALALVMAVFGFLSGRDRQIHDTRPV